MNNTGLVSLKNFPKIQKLEKLYLNNNQISEGLENLWIYPNLRTLDISQNNICQFELIQPLTKFEFLECLALEGNPFVSATTYEKNSASVFKLLPHLCILDHKDLDGNHAEDDMSDFSLDAGCVPPNMDSEDEAEIISTKDKKHQKKESGESVNKKEIKHKKEKIQKEYLLNKEYHINKSMLKNIKEKKIIKATSEILSDKKISKKWDNEMLPKPLHTKRRHIEKKKESIPKSDISTQEKYLRKTFKEKKYLKDVLNVSHNEAQIPEMNKMKRKRKKLK